MNFRELQEAEVVNFADRAEQTLNRVGAFAKTAFGKFKSAKDKAAADIEADVEAADAHAEKTSADTAKSQKSQLLAKAGPKTAHITLARLILDRTPEEGDLPELEDLDAEHFQYVKQGAEQIQHRLEKFTKNLTKVMREAPFINAQDRKEVPDRLGDQDDRIVEAAENMLMQDKYGEQSAWMQALTNDDPNVGAKALMSVLGRISASHGKLNQAQAKKVYAEGLNIINVVGAQRQIIEMRVGLMKAALEQMSKKSISEALLKRIGNLSKRL